MFTAAKDALVSRAAQSWLNQLIARYGEVQSMKIDSRRKTITVTCTLEGEAVPVTITVGNYVVETEGDRKYIRVADFQCTRPWLQTLLADFGSRQRFELPRLAAAAL